MPSNREAKYITNIIKGKLVIHVQSKKEGKDQESIQSKIVSEYDQEIPQSQTADNPVAPRGRVAQPTGDTRKTN